MHRAYRATMTMGTIGLATVAARQTYWGLRQGMVTEVNPLQGSNPSVLRQAAIVGGGAGLMLVCHRLVERLPGDDFASEYIKDALLTIPVAVEVFDVWSNTQTLGANNWRNW